MEPAAGASRRIALFDLDGTLTRRDTYVPFVLGLLLRHPARWVRTPLLLVAALRYLLGGLDRGGLKGSILHLLFGGLPRNVLENWATHFTAASLATRMHEAGVATLKSHLQAGDHVVLLSASPDLYVPLIGHGLGVHEVHCTCIRWEGDRLDGRLAGPNRRDHEKVRVLEQLRAASPGLPVIAYGNSAPDLIHMRLCEEAVYVNPAAPEAASLTAAGMRCVRWS
ncbi:MAG TPA: HAD-IB family phosphatase [Steroidobacteraceae bacterium]|nr:HAD-IB family phosphatase [Steroidobacteraceae bacterium]